ncbi:Hypothetical protein, putative [Bodo saltans]|uniref:Uncharacterized protein n=1 Tax=Bodo saltans TaxID=75058 RepID=A0A0S4JM91_BODSA|nr:Hypothetical protein, putative [Bodo saltans]|eukprot:CUG92638.1 Hypothetical protein, putative [Bodo saltans]
MTKTRSHVNHNKTTSPSAISAPPPISGIGMSSDALVFMYPLLNRLTEKGASLPFRFPDTVLYEHHFPRGWFSVEREPEAAAALRRGHKEPSPVELLRGASPFLHSDVPVRDKKHHASGDEHNDAQKLVLVRRVAKECDSGIIRKAFCATRASPTMAALCVSRHPVTDAVVIRYLNDAGLADTLLSSPETCLLSKMVPSRRPQFDVLVATWTPSVYSVEHRQNRHMLHDESRTVQERGDITTPSEYQELHCSSLTAERIRDHLFQFMSYVASVEKKYIGEIRAYFRTDHKERLWFLWCDVCRFATPRAVSGLHVTVQGGEDPKVLWDRIEREVAWRKEMERERSAAALIGGSGPAQMRGEESEIKKLDRLCDTHYGRHPSFAHKLEDVDPETADIVERQLQQLLNKAKGKAPAAAKKAGGGDKDGKKKRTLRGAMSSSSMSSTTRTVSPSDGIRDKGGKVSWMTRRYLAGTSWVENPSASDGLMPMVPLSMQPLPLSLLQANTSFGGGTVISSGEPSPMNASSAGTSSVVSPARAGDRGITLSVDVLGEMASSVVFIQNSTVGQFATSPAFPTSPSAVDDESPTSQLHLSGSRQASLLGEKRRSIIKYAPRPEEVRGAPSKWMRTVKNIAAGDSVIEDTPRGRQAQHDDVSARRGGPQRGARPPAPDAGGLLLAPPHALDDSSRIDGDDGEKSARSEDFFEALGGVKEGAAAVRPFIPGPGRLNRVRASVVLSKQADMLDISSRLEYNELKRVHAAAIDELQDLQYFCNSEALRSREAAPILFDLPHGTPGVPAEIMRKIGFSLVVDDPEMDRMYLERYYFISTGLHIAWAFEHLTAAVEDLCYQEELRYWQAKIFARQLGVKGGRDSGSAARIPLWSGVGDSSTDAQESQGSGGEGDHTTTTNAGSFKKEDHRRSIRRDNTTVTIATPTTLSLNADTVTSPAPDVVALPPST